jgi:hypothetical protein
MVNIQVNDAVAAALTAQAQSQGLSLEEYLAVLARKKSAVALPRMTGEELDRLLDAEATPGTGYEGTYSRAEIYQNHD